MEQTLNFDIVSGIKTLTDNYCQLDDAYLVAHISSSIARNRFVDEALRVDGMTVLLVKSGQAVFEINMESFEAVAPSICVIHPSSRIFVRDNDDVEISLLFMSQRFLQNININVSAFNLPSMLERPSPVMGLEPGELELMGEYLRLLERNCSDGASRQLALSVGASLVGALVYEMAKMQYRRINAASGDDGARPRSARVGYVRDFMKLVHAHYATERSVAFYASKLFISPKYLSLVVRRLRGAVPRAGSMSLCLWKPRICCAIRARTYSRWLMR